MQLRGRGRLSFIHARRDAMKNIPGRCWIVAFETPAEVRLMGQARMAVESAGGVVMKLSDVDARMIYCSDRELTDEIRAALKAAGA
jgi:hypothetical protein